MTSVDAAIVEINTALAVLQPQLEGLRDFERLNLHEDARHEIVASIEQYARREAYLLDTKVSLEGLVADGYPELAIREIVQNAFNDLKENVTTIQAAFSQFTPGTAVTLQVTAGEVELK